MDVEAITTKVKQEFAAKEKGVQRRRSHRSRTEVRKESGCLTANLVQNISRSLQAQAPHFFVRCPSTHPLQLPRQKRRGDISPPPDGQRRPVWAALIAREYELVAFLVLTSYQ